MLALKKIFLHHWHRFRHELIHVEDSLYLAGHNGSGKSSILDAIQVVLIGDGHRMRFNSSAQDRSHRNLETYVRGKIGEHRLLRPGNTIAYIALEFQDSSPPHKQVTVGVCIECRDNTTERTFFIIDGELEPERFVLQHGGKPQALTRRELKLSYRNIRRARFFEQVNEYQLELRNSLGGLHERFFDLFLRALTFQPMRDIREFVERWLLEERKLDIETFQHRVERYGQLRREAVLVEEKLDHLKQIVEEQHEFRRLHNFHEVYMLLASLLRYEHDARRLTHLEQEQTRLEQQFAAKQEEQEQIKAAFEGANNALIAAHIQLGQLDVIRRRDEIQKKIDEVTREANEIVQRRKQLRDDLARATEPLAILQSIETPYVQASERQTLLSLEDVISTLSPSLPPPPSLFPMIDAAIQTLDDMYNRVQPNLYDQERLQNEGKKRREELIGELERLRREGRTPYPKDVERVRDMLEGRLGQTRPKLLCELIEVPDEHWQNAVEAMLGRRRFHLIVPPRFFDEAVSELDRMRSEEKIYGVGIIDLERASKEARSARHNSLAEKVTYHASEPLLRGYLNTILGNIMCCERVQDLRNHARAITPEVVLYSEWSVMALRPDSYTPRYIGKRAIESQIEACVRELHQIERQVASGEPLLKHLKDLYSLLNRAVRTFPILRERFDTPLDDTAHRQEIKALQADLVTLDLSGVAELQRDVERFSDLVKQAQENKDRCSDQLAALKNERDTNQKEHYRMKQQVEERKQEAEDARLKFAHVNEDAEQALAKQLQTTDLSEAIRNAESTGSGFKTRADNTFQRIHELGTAYNIKYQFAAIVRDPNEQRYAEEEQRLSETELPRYRSQIEQAQREAEEELREHVLHRLREYIGHAREELNRINDALRTIDFHGERYRFRSSPAEDVREYYDIITESQSLGSDSLYQSEFYEKHKPTFDRFYDLLMREANTDAEKKEQARLIDYRSYLDYDIDVIHSDGHSSRLSRIMGQTSGGETQTPFYVTIAASFAQLYHINDPHSRPTIRLVAFDEAFSKMDQDRIGATLKLLQGFGLQIITATPLERCEYLVPHVCTSLVLTALKSKDEVVIEPYRNYMARLLDFNQAAAIIADQEME